jgi:hypothetical protein
MSMVTTARVVADTCDTASSFSVLAQHIAYLASQRAAEARGTDQAEADRWLLILASLNKLVAALDKTTA